LRPEVRIRESRRLLRFLLIVGDGEIDRRSVSGGIPKRRVLDIETDQHGVDTVAGHPGAVASGCTSDSRTAAARASLLVAALLITVAFGVRARRGRRSGVERDIGVERLVVGEVVRASVRTTIEVLT